MTGWYNAVIFALWIHNIIYHNIKSHLYYLYDPTKLEGSPDVGMIVMHSSHVPPPPKVTDTFTKFDALQFCVYMQSYLNHENDSRDLL